MNTRVLVTGGSGALGRAVVNRLGMIGCKITVLDLVPYEGRTELEYMCQGDISNRQTVLKATQGVDAVIHCAGVRDVSIFPNEKHMQKVNVGGAHNLIYACVENKVRTLLNASTVEVLYHAEHVYKAQDETAQYPPFHHMEYCRTKKDAETAFLTAADHKTFKVVNMRFGLLFGPDSWQMRQNLERAKKLQLKSISVVDARGTLGEFPHIYIDNAAHAFMLALIQAHANPHRVSGKTYNVFDFHENMSRVQFSIMEQILCCNPWMLQYAQGSAQFYRFYSYFRKLLTGISTSSEHLSGHYIRMMLHKFICTNERAKKELGYEPLVGEKEAYQITCMWLYKYLSETPGYNIYYQRPRSQEDKKMTAERERNKSALHIYTANEQQASTIGLNQIPRSWT